MANPVFLFFTITMLAYFIKALTGFGNTLVMNSILAIFKENRLVTPLDLLLSVPANAYLAWKNRRHINFKIVIPLSVAVILGNIPGTLLLGTGPDRLLKVILGVVLLLLALEMQFHKSKANIQKWRPELFWIIGIISGVLMGLFGIGALLAAAIDRFAGNRSEYRGNLCFVFTFDNIFRCLSYGWQSILNWQIIKLSLALLPAALLGMGLGSGMDLHLSDDHIRKGIQALMAASGLFLTINHLHP